MSTLDKRELIKIVNESECLHCRVGALVRLHYAQHGERRDNMRLISVADACWAMGQVVGELIAVHPDAAKRESIVCELADDVRSTIADVLKDGARMPGHDIAWTQ